MIPTTGSIVANRFQLVRELGRGSMGTVWLAQHLTLQARCAVKFMSNEAMADPNFAARFELEARAIAQLNSPNVVRVIDHDSHDGRPFIAMECLHGEDLGARLRRMGRLDASTTYRVVTQLANGLARAHAVGIVHRDLKPENIFLAQGDDGDEVAKLLDFGVAKMTGEAPWDGAAGRTQAGAILGTPAYMSPEQARGSEVVDHRADLWSLAVVVFECLTGRLPFDGSALGDVFAKILCEPLPVPSEVDPACTVEFDRWWLKAAARNPEYRFRDAPELAESLGRALRIVEVPDDVRDTLHSRNGAAKTLARQVPRRTRWLAGALVVAVAPLVATLARGGMDARSSADAAGTASERPVASAAAVQTPVPRLSAPAVTEPAPALTAAQESKAVVISRAAARADSLRSTPAPARRASTVPPSPVDDVDFGI